MDKHVPPHLLLLIVKTLITNRPQSKAKRQFHQKAIALLCWSFWRCGCQLLRTTDFHMSGKQQIYHTLKSKPSKKIPSRLFGRITGIGTVWVMTLMRDSANLFWQVLQNTFFHIQDCLTHTPASWLQKHDNAGVWKAYCHYWLWSS